jgi:mono/diheme cytochrome c family protein
MTLIAASAALLVLGGCHVDMWAQPKNKPQQASDFFADKRASRAPVVGTVKFGAGNTNDAMHTGYDKGKLVENFPVEVTEELIRRGKNRFEIYCTPCHGQAGDGKGMIAQRGFTASRPIPSYQTDRLRKMPVGYFFDVITNGYGAMYPFADRIEVKDRWAIASYIRALQLSQNATLADVPDTERQRLANEDPTTASPTTEATK